MALSSLISAQILILLAAVVISAMVLENGANYKIPQEVLHSDVKYIILPAAVNFTQAQRLCEMVHADLVAILDEETNLEFIKFIEQLQDGNGRFLNPWIGGRRNNTYDNFVWVSTGEVFNYTNWPANSNEGDKAGCVYYQRVNVEGWKWHVGDCNSRKIVVCEYD